MADLHISDAQPTAIEAKAIDATLPNSAAVQQVSERLVLAGVTRRRELRHHLLPALHAAQNARGWISPGAVNHIADRLQVPPAEIYGVASFYEMFRTSDPGHSDDVVHVCVDAACQIAGADDLASSLGVQHAVHRSPCLGQCERAPAIFVQGCGRPDRVEADASAAIPLHQSPEGLRLCRRVGVVDPTSLDSYLEHGGYRALRLATDRGPDRVIDDVTSSGLSGRGGAAFPTGGKWRAVADQDGPKHVVANCDESEPGTFKDRVLLENDPFSLIEALTIAGFATGAEMGWIYIRGEYPRATEQLALCIAAARDAGFLGSDVGGHGFDFDIELRRGAGAYICGEETALFNSIEGYRGEPRNKPPFPTTHGLFARPTAINNPETLVNVLHIVEHGPEEYRSVGTDGSPGTKLFCVSGRVTRPGLYEVPFGTQLGELLQLAGTPTDEVRAILLGGAAGTFVLPTQVDLELSLEGARAAGTTLGSGVVMPIGVADDMTAVLVRLAEFFRNESCGQCVPCRVGTVRQHELLVGISGSGGVDTETRDLIDDVAEVMADASICGLGHTAASAVRSALDQGLVGVSR